MRPLIQEPLCKVLLQLVNLPLNDLYRASVLDVLTSPLYVTDLYDGLSESYRPEQWKLLVQALRITHGVEEWTRLERASHAALVLDGEESSVGSPAIGPDVIRLLWQAVFQLAQDCAALPLRGTIGQMVVACRAFIDRRLRRPEAEESAAEDDQPAFRTMAWDAIDRIWVTCLELEPLQEEITWAEFVELLSHTFERTSTPLQKVSGQGCRRFRRDGGSRGAVQGSVRPWPERQGVSSFYPRRRVSPGPSRRLRRHPRIQDRGEADRV